VASSNGTLSLTPESVVQDFAQRVIDRVAIQVEGITHSYSAYLSLPAADRSGDEANAVDNQFARYVLEWLGFAEAHWQYNVIQGGQKANRPDYIVSGSVGTAFIWEDKNSSLDLETEHLLQMRRYSIGTAGYAVWCNMRRILAVRFSQSESLQLGVTQLSDTASGR
jgi:hypothetical protein